MAIWDGKPWFVTLVGNVLNPAKAIMITLCDFLPKPTQDNVEWKNAKSLVELRDWFLAHETNRLHGGYDKMYEAIFNLAIIKYETDTTYQVRFEETFKKALEMLKEGKWEFPERPRHKEQHWNYDA